MTAYRTALRDKEELWRNRQHHIPALWAIRNELRWQIRKLVPASNYRLSKILEREGWIGALGDAEIEILREPSAGTG